MVVIVYWLFIIAYMIVAVVAIGSIFSSKLLSNKEAAVAIALFMLGPVGALLFEPIRDQLKSGINTIFLPKTSIYKIVIFGRPGSGKTTFIETAFTVNPNTIPRSTQDFKYYQFRVYLGRTDSDGTEVAIADYKGQDPSQIILESQQDQDFFGPPRNRVINAIVFIVDLVHRKSDEGNPFNDQALLEWLKSGNMLDKIKARVEEHYGYIGEATLQVLLRSLHSQNLKSVIFVINKIDLIEKLIDDGYLTLSNGQDAREYAKYHFKRMIEYVSTACQQLSIEDFSNDDSLVFTVSANRTDDLKPLIFRLLRRRS